MKQEPVACIVDDELYFAHEIDWEELNGTPLYTAPRELSDEEILDCVEKSDLPMILLSDFATEKMKVFARAILKKASEK